MQHAPTHSLLFFFFLVSHDASPSNRGLRGLHSLTTNLSFSPSLTPLTAFALRYRKQDSGSPAEPPPPLPSPAFQPLQWRGRQYRDFVAPELTFAVTCGERGSEESKDKSVRLAVIQDEGFFFLSFFFFLATKSVNRGQFTSRGALLSDWLQLQTLNETFPQEINSNVKDCRYRTACYNTKDHHQSPTSVNKVQAPTVKPRCRGSTPVVSVALWQS